MVARMAERSPVDVLLVSPGTTAGWRRVDADFAQLLRELGLTVATATTDFPIARHLRRTMPLTDLVEAAAMRRATTRALHRWNPRAIVYSSTQAPMLQPADRIRGAGVRFDALTTVNRPGPANALTHRLERRVLRLAGVLLPSGLDPARRLPTSDSRLPPAIALPLPIDPAPARARRPIALCYAGNPAKKGLDTIAAAWKRLSPPLDLVITGIDAAAGRRFLAERHVAEPAGAEWAGLVDAARFRELTASAELFVSASRFEDYGLAQLEALADGALLVTTPSAGPYEALPIAEQLAPSLVSNDLTAALRAALSMNEADREAYRARAREVLRPHSREEARRRVREGLLPILFPADGQPPTSN
jgi:glycosyl transferase family 1